MCNLQAPIMTQAEGIDKLTTQSKQIWADFACHAAA